MSSVKYTHSLNYNEELIYKYKFNNVCIEEKELWAAVLERAIRDYLRLKGVVLDIGYAGPGLTHFDSTKTSKKSLTNEYERILDWFNSRSESFGSFIWICQLIHLNPKNLLKMIYSYDASEGFKLKALNIWNKRKL